MTLLTIISAAAVVGLIVLSAFVLSVVRGAGTEIGKAGLAESAPWIAKFTSRIALRFTLLRQPDLFQELDRELLTLVEEEFRERTGVTERARGIFVVLRETWGLATAASDLRDTPLSPSLPDAKPAPPKPSEIDWEAPGPPRVPNIGPLPVFNVRTLQAMSSAAELLAVSTDQVAKTMARIDTRSLEVIASSMMATSEALDRAMRGLH